MLKSCRSVISVNLDQLSYFVAIASYGSLSSASRHLSVSQQALSSYLSDLERGIGMPLFFRNRQKLLLTEAGKRYLKGAQDILNEIGRAQSAIQMLDCGPNQELHVGISAHSGALLLAECALEFSRRYPGVQLIPHEGYSFDLRRMVREGHICAGYTLGQRTLALEGNAQEGGLSARPLRKKQVIDEEQRRKAYVRRVFRVHVLPWLG